jgi:hypothetical protein
MKKYNYLLTLLAVIAFNNCLGQMGIDTNTPQQDLHINGSLQITKDLVVGGDELNKGSSGNLNDVLTSQGKGKSVKWSKLEEVSIIPYVIGVFDYESTTTNLSGSLVDIKFNNFIPIKEDYIEFNNVTREITISKAGFYRFYSLLTINTSENPDGYTAGEARSSLFRNNDLLAAKSTTHGERTLEVYHNVYGIGYFAVGDKLTLKVYRQQKYRVTKTNLILLYSGDYV